MHRHRTVLGLAGVAGLLLGAAIAFAEDAPPPSSPGPRPAWQFCKENPGKCEEARAKRREFCKQNPEKCQEQRAQMKQRRAEMKAKCEADPARCQEMKQQMRERKHPGHGMGNDPHEPAPTPAP